MFCLRVICMCDQSDSLFCALQLTALIKPNWYVLLYCFASLYHSLIVVQPSWTTVPCPTTRLRLLISKSFVGIKQSVISVALKTPLKNQIGNLYLQNFASAFSWWLYWFYIKLSTHILQQNCAHAYQQQHDFTWLVTNQINSRCKLTTKRFNRKVKFADLLCFDLIMKLCGFLRDLTVK